MPIKNQLMNMASKRKEQPPKEQPVKAVPAPAKPVAPSKLETSEVKQAAEASLSPQLLRKLLSDEKLTTDEQKAVAAVCKAVGFL